MQYFPEYYMNYILKKILFLESDEIENWNY